jgi:hypothetical protein
MLRNREAVLAAKAQGASTPLARDAARRGPQTGDREGDGMLRPKGSDVLMGFIELRKGIFMEKRDKVRENVATK